MFSARVILHTGGREGHGERVFLTRASACIVMVLSFSLLAVPVFKGNREVGNTITAHTLFQGMMVCAEQNAHFGSISYDSGFYNYDHPIIARIRAYAKRIGEHRAVEDLTRVRPYGMRRVRDILVPVPQTLSGGWWLWRTVSTELPMRRLSGEVKR